MTDDPNPVPKTGSATFKAALHPQLRRSDRQIVRESLPEIVGKLKEGWHYEQIRVDLERTVGFKGKLSTLYDYVEKLTREERQRQAPGVTPATPAGPETSADSSSETPVPSDPPRRRISDLAGPGYAERMKQREREREEKKKKPKTTMVDMVNRRI